MNKPKDIGAPPGTLFYTGEQSGRIRITLIEYNEREFIEAEFFSIDDCIAHVKPDMVKWINVEGVHDTAIIESLGKIYNLHPLTLEDIVHIEQRPKFEDYDHYLLCVMKMIKYSQAISSEQLS